MENSEEIGHRAWAQPISHEAGRESPGGHGSARKRPGGPDPCGAPSCVFPPRCMLLLRGTNGGPKEEGLSIGQHEGSNM